MTQIDLAQRSGIAGPAMIIESPGIDNERVLDAAGDVTLELRAARQNCALRSPDS